MLTNAATSGWCAGVGTFEDVMTEARRMRLESVENRRGEPHVTRLRPTTRSEAKPHSLSAQVGLGVQPLHTDGAHQEEPADFLVLMSEQPSATPTMLRHIDGRDMPSNELRGGMFLVGVGSSAFFAPALVGFGPTRRLRFDPGCMAACDLRAHKAAKYLCDTTTANRFDWATPGQVLVIDNKRTLHGRGEVQNGELDRELVRIAFRRAKT